MKLEVSLLPTDKISCFYCCQGIELDQILLYWLRVLCQYNSKVYGGVCLDKEATDNIPYKAKNDICSSRTRNLQPTLKKYYKFYLKDYQMRNHGFNISAILITLILGLFGEAMASKDNTKSSFVLFESGQVRPLALSPDGRTLFAVNTPDNRLEVFHVSDKGLNHLGSVSVGLEPVSLAVRSNNEVWVVNHLSDSVSIVKINKRFRLQKLIRNRAKKPLLGRVVRTLHVGDEPRDIVFGGAQYDMAFITTAQRVQN